MLRMAELMNELRLRAHRALLLFRLDGGFGGLEADPGVGSVAEWFVD